MTIPSITLNDGHEIPAIGFGTAGLRGDDAIESVTSALHSGYRLLDSAMNYGNEREVGEAVRRSGVPRDEVIVTTKLPGRHHGFDETLASFEESSSTLGLDHVDLYLIHWPNPSRGRFADSWRAMVRLRDEGRVRSIGVSNFTPAHLGQIVDPTGVQPAINQIELHPNFPQADQREFDRANGIVTESWSPLGTRERLTGEPVVVAAASAHRVTPTQVVLRWHLQLGAVPLPRSSDAGRQRENLHVFGFELSGDEMAAISALESGRLGGADPDVHEEM